VAISQITPREMGWSNPCFLAGGGLRGRSPKGSKKNGEKIDAKLTFAIGWGPRLGNLSSQRGLRPEMEAGPASNRHSQAYTLKLESEHLRLIMASRGPIGSRWEAPF